MPSKRDALKGLQDAVLKEKRYPLKEVNISQWLSDLYWARVISPQMRRQALSPCSPASHNSGAKRIEPKVELCPDGNALIKINLGSSSVASWAIKDLRSLGCEVELGATSGVVIVSRVPTVELNLIARDRNEKPRRIPPPSAAARTADTYANLAARAVAPHANGQSSIGTSRPTTSPLPLPKLTELAVKREETTPVASPRATTPELERSKSPVSGVSTFSAESESTNASPNRIIMLPSAIEQCFIKIRREATQLQEGVNKKFSLGFISWTGRSYASGINKILKILAGDDTLQQKLKAIYFEVLWDRVREQQGKRSLFSDAPVSVGIFKPTRAKEMAAFYQDYAREIQTLLNLPHIEESKSAFSYYYKG